MDDKHVSGPFKTSVGIIAGGILGWRSIAGKSRRTEGALQTVKRSICRLSLCPQCQGLLCYSLLFLLLESIGLGQAELSVPRHSETSPPPIRQCVHRPTRPVSGRGELPTQAVASDLTAIPRPRMAPPDQSRVARGEKPGAFFPPSHLLPEEGLKVVCPAALPSVDTHLQPHGPSLGPAAVHSSGMGRGGG